jgi:hypothetical protein
MYLVGVKIGKFSLGLRDRKRQLYRSSRDDMGQRITRSGLENGISSRVYLEFALSCSNIELNSIYCEETFLPKNGFPALPLTGREGYNKVLE